MLKVVHKPKSIGFITKNKHMYFFAPSNSHGIYSAYGCHFRKRLKNNTWQQTILRLHVRGDKPHKYPGGKGTRTYELQQYITKKASTSIAGQRLTYKRFIRFKVGFGGDKVT